MQETIGVYAAPIQRFTLGLLLALNAVDYSDASSSGRSRHTGILYKIQQYY